MPLVGLPEDSGQRQSIVDGAELLGQLLLQDVERKSGDVDVDVDAHADAADDGVSIRDGVSKDRMLSVHDPVGDFATRKPTCLRRHS